jgi:hypothetical protein
VVLRADEDLLAEGSVEEKRRRVDGFRDEAPQMFTEGVNLARPSVGKEKFRGAQDVAGLECLSSWVVLLKSTLFTSR